MPTWSDPFDNTAPGSLGQPGGSDSIVLAFDDTAPGVKTLASQAFAGTAPGGYSLPSQDFDNTGPSATTLAAQAFAGVAPGVKTLTAQDFDNTSPGATDIAAISQAFSQGTPPVASSLAGSEFTNYVAEPVNQPAPFDVTNTPADYKAFGTLFTFNQSSVAVTIGGSAIQAQI